MGSILGSFSFPHFAFEQTNRQQVDHQEGVFKSEFVLRKQRVLKHYFERHVVQHLELFRHNIGQDDLKIVIVVLYVSRFKHGQGVAFLRATMAAKRALDSHVLRNVPPCTKRIGFFACVTCLLNPVGPRDGIVSRVITVTIDPGRLYASVTFNAAIRAGRRCAARQALGRGGIILLNTGRAPGSFARPRFHVSTEPRQRQI